MKELIRERRFNKQNPELARPTQKRCSKCRKWLKTDYSGRIATDSFPKQRAICFECDRKNQQKRARSRRQRLVRELGSRLADMTSPDAMIAWLDYVGSQLCPQSGMAGLAKEWVEYIETASPHARIRAIQHILHMAASIDIYRAVRDHELKPLHLELMDIDKHGALIPALRKLINTGYITLNDIDPPPEETG